MAVAQKILLGWAGAALKPYAVQERGLEVHPHLPFWGSVWVGGGCCEVGKARPKLMLRFPPSLAWSLLSPFAPWALAWPPAHLLYCCVHHCHRALPGPCAWELTEAAAAEEWAKDGEARLCVDPDLTGCNPSARTGVLRPGPSTAKRSELILGLSLRDLDVSLLTGDLKCVTER